MHICSGVVCQGGTWGGKAKQHPDSFSHIFNIKKICSLRTDDFIFWCSLPYGRSSAPACPIVADITPKTGLRK